MKSVCQYDGIKLYRPVTDGEKKLFADMLVKRFQGDRYKSFLTFDDSSGDPIIAYVQVIDFLDPEHLLVGKSGCRWRFYLEPVAHCFLGKPESLYEAARAETHRFLNNYRPLWGNEQGRDYVCIEVREMPARDMDCFIYQILMDIDVTTPELLAVDKEISS